MFRSVYNPCGIAECPKCGCADTIPLGRRTRFGRETEKARCRNCHNEFSAPVPEAPDPAQAPPVQVPPAAPPQGAAPYKSASPGGASCPACGHRPWPVTSSPKETYGGVRIRKHKCKCGCTGESHEVV